MALIDDCYNLKISSLAKDGLKVQTMWLLIMVVMVLCFSACGSPGDPISSTQKIATDDPSFKDNEEPNQAQTAAEKDEKTTFPSGSQGEDEVYTQPNPHGGDIVDPELPRQFPKRILFEQTTSNSMYNGAWANEKLRDPLIKKFGDDKVITRAFQNGVFMGSDVARAQMSLIVTDRYKIGEVAVDRMGGFTNYSNFNMLTNSRISEVPQVGLKIATTADSVIVYVGFLQDIPGDVRLSVDLVEDAIADQRNGTKLTDVIKNYKLNNMVMIILAESLLGDKISARAGTIIRKSYPRKTKSKWTGFGCFAGIHESEMKAEKSSVVAYVHTIGSDPKSTQVVLNAKEVPVGTSDTSW